MKLNEMVFRLDEKYNDEVKIEIKCTESAALECLLPMLKHIQSSGGTGHSFEIDVDPNAKMGEGRDKYGFDGDGSHRINSIKTNGEEYKSKK